MDVDVEFVWRDVEVEGGDGVAAGGDHVAVGDLDGGAQDRVGDGAVVDDQGLRCGCRAGNGGRADVATDAQHGALGIALLGDRQHDLGGFGTEQGGDAVDAGLRRGFEDRAAVEFQAKGDLRGREGQAADDGLGVFGLDARGLEEFAAGGGGEEQVADDDAGAGGARCGGDGYDAAAFNP